MSMIPNITFKPTEDKDYEGDYEILLNGQFLGMITPGELTAWISPQSLQRAVSRAVKIAAKEKFGEPIELEFHD